MATFINLTQHNPMPAQTEAGITNLPQELNPIVGQDQDGKPMSKLQQLLTFDSAPSLEEMAERAEKIAELAKAAGADRAMIGGAAYSMPALEQALEAQGITPTYAFTEMAERGTTPDGKPKRVLEHRGFVDAYQADRAPDSNAPDVSEIKGAAVLNLMNFGASAEQKADGVFEPKDKKAVQALVNVTGSTPPSREDINRRAEALAEIAASELEGKDKKFALIGGMPLYLRDAVEAALEDKGIKPVHSFTKRIVTGEKEVNGKTVKEFVFKHEQFLESGAGKNPKGLGNEATQDLSQPERKVAL